MADSSYLNSLSGGINAGVGAYSQQAGKKKKSDDDENGNPVEAAISRRMKQIQGKSDYMDAPDMEEKNPTV